MHGSPPGARAVSKKASNASNASRAVAGARSAPCHGNGDDDGDGLEEAFGRGGAALDVDVLRRAPRGAAFAQPLEQPRAARAAAAKDDRDS